MANTAWAYSRLEHAAPALFDVIAAAAAPRMAAFAGLGIVMLLAAFARADHAAGALFNAAVDALEAAPHLRDDVLASPQGVAQLLWAHARLNCRIPETLCAALVAARCGTWRAGQCWSWASRRRRGRWQR